MSRLQWVLLGAVMLVGSALVTSALYAKVQGDRALRGHGQAAVTGDPGSSDGTTASPQTNKGGHGRGQSAAAVAARADRQAQKAAAKGAKAAAKALRRSQAAGTDPGATDGEDANDDQDVDDDNQDGADVEQEGDNDDGDEDDGNVQLPAAAAVALLAAFPGAVIGEVDLDDEDGLELFEVELKQGDAEIEVKVAPDGTIVEIEQEVAIEAVPAAAAAVIQGAAAGGTIREIEMEEVRAQVQTVDGVPTLVPLDPPQVVYEAEIETGGQKGEIKVAADGTVLEPLTLEGNDEEDGNVDSGDADDNDDDGGATAAGGVQGLKVGGAPSGGGAGHGHAHQD